MKRCPSFIWDGVDEGGFAPLVVRGPAHYFFEENSEAPIVVIFFMYLCDLKIHIKTSTKFEEL